MADKKDNSIEEFQITVLKHLDTAYNFAVWLCRNRHDAEDITQEACLRAFAAFDRFDKKSPRAWLLTIVRHTFLTHQSKQKRGGEIIYIDALTDTSHIKNLTNQITPEQQISDEQDIGILHCCLNKLADDFREILVLRELEGLSYNEISQIVDCPIGTVMSRLARARNQLRGWLESKDFSLEEQA